jgi:NTE family protein
MAYMDGRARLRPDPMVMKPSLRQIPFLQTAPEAALAALEDDAEWFSIPAGWRLFGAGEPADGLSFLVSGSLAAFRPGSEGGSQLIGYIRPGEPVGEMALISGEPHTASVFAMRDSEVLRLSATTFDALVRAHPELMAQMARLMLSRARAANRASPRAEPKVYALISTSPTIDLRLRARALADALKRLGKRARIVGEEAADHDSRWFDRVEHDHDAVFLISPIADTHWFRTCLRQADRIWVLGRSDAHPSTPLLPEEEQSPARQFRLVDVVLLHHAGVRPAASSEEWRSACDAARLFHWHGLEDADADRLARTIAQRAVGLVLSGGGARAYAHIGVVRAIREAGVPFDIVCGTSMGGIVAACVAMGWSDDEIELRIRKAFVESNPLGDYVLPVVALSAGKRVEDRLREHFGEARIEDLRTPFFCVSTNLAAGAIRVHREGLLRQALRASISLPGILPPVVDGDGLLVDGAVLQNFPVATLKEMHRGPIIGVDVARQSKIDPRDFRDPPNFLGWVGIHGLQTPPPIATLLMRTATLGIDLWQGRTSADLLIAPDLPGIDLRDWKLFDDAVAAGYEAAAQALQQHHGLFHAGPDDDEALIGHEAPAIAMARS